MRKRPNEFQISPVKSLTTSPAVVSRNNLCVPILDNHLTFLYEWRQWPCPIGNSLSVWGARVHVHLLHWYRRPLLALYWKITSSRQCSFDCAISNYAVCVTTILQQLQTTAVVDENLSDEAVFVLEQADVLMLYWLFLHLYSLATRFYPDVIGTGGKQGDTPLPE